MAKIKVADKKNSEEKNSKKRKNLKNKNNKLIDSIKMNIPSEAQSAIWIVLIVFIVLIAFYFLTTKLVDPVEDEETEDDGVEFQYEEILAGSSFNRKEEEYYVVYYDIDATEDDSDVQDLDMEVSDYIARRFDEVVMYKCDLENPFNSTFITKDEPNTNPASVGELKLNGTTLIKFSNGSVTEYKRGTTEIKDYLKSLNEREF